MKNKIFSIVSLLTCMVIVSCENRINEIVPRASLAPQLVSSSDDVEKLLVGAYDGLIGGTGGASVDTYYLSMLTEDLSADNLIYRATFFQHGEVNDNAILVSNVLVSRYFTAPYVAIYRANEIIKIIDGISAANFSTPERKAEIIAESKYIRALAYYRLVTLFGGVPVVTVNTTDNLPRNTEEEVWVQIENDLDDAIADAADFEDHNYISNDAAKAFRARVALIREDFALAGQLAEEVIASGNFSLAENYGDIFAEGSDGAGEVIFQLNYTITEGQNAISFFLLDPTVAGPGAAGGRFELPVDPNLVAAYEAGDERRNASIAPARGTSFQAIKYPSGGNAADPWYLNRISEMYLISDEADVRVANDPSAGMTRLNEVRVKRGLAAAATPATVSDYITLALQERRVEFAFESLRWTDLKRTGRAIAVLPNVTVADQLLYPIPQSQIDVNPLLEQNPGY